MQRSWIAVGLVAVIFLYSVSGSAEQITTAPVPVTGMGYGMMLFRMVLMLGAVCALATVSLRWGLKRLSRVHRAGQSIEVVSRAVIEPRRAILVVRIGTRHLVVGTGEHGMTPLGELSEEEASALKDARESQEAATGAPSFRKIFSTMGASETRQSAFVLEHTKNAENVQSL